GAASTCSLTVDGIENVTATFDLQQFTLTVPGGTAVTPVGESAVECTETSCGFTRPYGTQFRVDYAPAECVSLSGWTGCDGDDGATCLVTLTGDRAVAVQTDYDPCCGDVCCGDPCCGSECCGDTCCVKPWMCNP
ncbi:MAG TPA: hypothetical protein VL172_01655, partial [Kofleriaceae bacterium]|nr:hypothetical protein [Kofleriaceae bacterium]